MDHIVWAEVDVNMHGTADFTVSTSPPSLTLTGVGTAQYTVVTSSAYGFAGPVSLSVAGLPAGATPTFGPSTFNLDGINPVYSTMAITTTAGTPTGTSTLTVTATSGGYSHTATVSLTIGASTVQQNTFTTSPGGLSFAVDGTSYTTTQSFNWATGTSHTASSPPVQTDTAGTQWGFAGWSDGEPSNTRKFTAGASSGTYRIFYTDRKSVV